MKNKMEFNEIKVSSMVFIFAVVFLIGFATLIPIIYILGWDAAYELSGIINLLMNILLCSMLIRRLDISKSGIIFLYNDFRHKVKFIEIFFIIIFEVCIAIGSTCILSYIICSRSPTLLIDFFEEFSPCFLSTNGYIICFFITVIIWPIIDEIVFRRTIFKKITEKFNIYVGMIVSTLISTSLQIGGGVVGIFVIGMINCILYRKYNNIFILILTHSISTLIFISFLGNFVINISKLNILTSKDILSSFYIGILFIFIGVIMLIIYINKNKIYLKENL